MSKAYWLIICICTALLQGIYTEATEELVKNCNSTLSRSSSKGICISLKNKLQNCPPLLKLLREKKFDELKETYCSEAGKSFQESWVCCPQEEYIDLSETFDSHPNFNLLPTPAKSVCGQSANTDRIIGGKSAHAGLFPWLARIAVPKVGNGTDEFICGGSIISKRYILSAAHCFVFKGVDVQISKVRVGDTHDDEEVECIEIGNSTICEKEEDIEPEDIIIHPEYSGQAGSQNDIALIRLNRDIKNISSPFVRPICLPFSKEFGIPPLSIHAQESTPSGNSNALVAGWGKLLNSDEIGSPDLQWITVPVKENSVCSNFFKANNVSITEQQICAGGDKGKGSCAGDSGGPLFFPAKPKKGTATVRNFLIGIVSFGKSQCAALNAPVVYSRVRKYLSWILDNIKE